MVFKQSGYLFLKVQDQLYPTIEREGRNTPIYTIAGIAT